MSDVNFYTHRDKSKSDMCKACETMHINNWEPETYMWLLEKYDVPYVEEEWIKIRDKAYAKDPYKMNGMSVIGKYLSLMKLKNWMEYKFADTERLREERAEKARLYGAPEEETEKRLEGVKEAFENGEISEAQYMTFVGTHAPAPDYSQNIVGGQPAIGGPAPAYPYPVNDNPFEKVVLPDIAAELTQEDKVALAIKWGTLYTAAEWVTLEEMYREYEKSFGLHNADLIRGTIQLCKLDLKGNQALDSGDMESYSKIARASDALRKSLKFTEAQRKEERNDSFRCYCKIVEFAEEFNDEEYIHPIDLKVDRDMVDRDIRDMKNFSQQLIKDDPAVFKMIEQYIKKMEALKQQEQDEAEALARGEKHITLTDQDLIDYREHEEEQREEDAEEN